MRIRNDLIILLFMTEKTYGKKIYTPNYLIRVHWNYIMRVSINKFEIKKTVKEKTTILSFSQVFDENRKYARNFERRDAFVYKTVKKGRIKY